jgi:hypothetical protein
VTIATIKSKAKLRPALGVALTGKAARQMERQDRGESITHSLPIRLALCGYVRRFRTNCRCDISHWP